MKAGQSRFDVGTRIEVVSVRSSDPDEQKEMRGIQGTLTHPFGDLPHSFLGVWITAKDGVPHQPRLNQSDRAGLCRGDRIKLLDSGEVVTV